MTDITTKTARLLLQVEDGIPNPLGEFPMAIEDGETFYGSSIAYGLAQALQAQLTPISDDAWKRQIRDWLFPQPVKTAPPLTGIDGAWNDPADTFRRNVLGITESLSQMLIEKNAAYGDAALNPIRVFSKAGTEEQLLVRLDDKLSRVSRGDEYAGDDTIKDLLGYLVLLLIARSAN